MLVTDQAKLIRMAVGGTRVIGRNSAGVRLFNVAEGEHVVSAARIEEGEDEAEAVVDAEDQTPGASDAAVEGGDRSEEHTSELQSLMRISYAVFCLKKKTTHKHSNDKTHHN